MPRASERTATAVMTGVARRQRMASRKSCSIITLHHNPESPRRAAIVSKTADAVENHRRIARNHKRRGVYLMILLPERTNLFEETRPIVLKTRHHHLEFGPRKMSPCATKAVLS